MYYTRAREPVAEPLFMTPREFVRELLEEADEATYAQDRARAERLVQRARLETQQ